MILEWECHCFLENAKDGDRVKTWLSELGQAADYEKGKLPQPKDPCPECGRKDRIRRMGELPAHRIREGSTVIFRPTKNVCSSPLVWRVDEQDVMAVVDPGWRELGVIELKRDGWGERWEGWDVLTESEARGRIERSEIDWSPVVDACELLEEYVTTPGFSPDVLDKYEHTIMEAAVEAVLGEGFWEKVNERLEEE